MRTARLNWPDESARPAVRDAPHFHQADSNICLDFHGDPLRAKLVVFSDGNHHMALEETLRAFLAQHSAVEEIFYTTTPPRIAMQMLRAGCLDIGNLRLSVMPHVFISPPRGSHLWGKKRDFVHFALDSPPGWSQGTSMLHSEPTLRCPLFSFPGR